MKGTNINSERWAFFSIVSLTIVALIGVIMRYKIGFEFPYLDQKHLQQAHSHFAFTGWVSQALMVLMIHILGPIPEKKISMYNIILIMNYVSAIGMLVAFSVQGYAFFSICFSTMSVVAAIGFAILFYKDLQSADHIKQKNWFKASLLFNLISFIGTGMLVYMLIAGHMQQKTYLSSVYWYLHFQYNGWFFFACMGIFIHHFHQHIQQITVPSTVFHLLFWSILPTYGLSILWMNFSLVILLVITLGGLAQLSGWMLFMKSARRGKILHHSAADFNIKVLFMFITIAATLKFLLQAASAVPELNTLVFGFRTIVIAYLHLILLAIITVALITFFYIEQMINRTRLSMLGIKVLVAGIFLNETALAVQGILSLRYIPVPGINETLFIIALLIFCGLILLIAGQRNIKEG